MRHQTITDQDIKHCKKLLLSLQKRITSMASESIHIDSENLADIYDRASQEEEIATGLQALNHQDNQLLYVNQALEKIKQGCYGCCDNCGIDIHIKRLKANPMAALCIACQELADKRE